MIPTDDEMDKWMVEVDKFESLFVAELSPYQQEKLYTHVLAKLQSIPRYNMHAEQKFHYEKMLILLRHHMKQNGYTHTLEEIEKMLAPEKVASTKKISRYVLATIFYYKGIPIDRSGFAGDINLFEKYKGELRFNNKDSLYHAYRQITNEQMQRERNAVDALNLLRREGDHKAIERLLEENKGIEEKS
jgi:hypothetical protein